MFNLLFGEEASVVGPNVLSLLVVGVHAAGSDDLFVLPLLQLWRCLGNHASIWPFFNFVQILVGLPRVWLYFIKYVAGGGRREFLSNST